jgi:parallel beta-helix repeat protein
MLFPSLNKSRLFLWVSSGCALGLSMFLMINLYTSKSVAATSTTAPMKKTPPVALAVACTLPEALPQTNQPDGSKAYILKKDTTLCAAKSYHLPIIIEASNVALNCNQAKLEGSAASKQASNRGKLVTGITSRGNSNVSIQNCTVSNFSGNGVSLLSSSWEMAPSKLSSQNVVDNVTTHNSGRVGVYLQVRDSTVKNSQLNGDTLGIYITSNSNRIVVSDTVIQNTTMREGIAIDAAFNNVIKGNTIRNNASHGVTLYKNCGEHASSNIRPHAASGNQILGNSITGHTRRVRLDRNPSQDITPGTGIAVALRQGKTLGGQQINHKTGAAEPCSDPKSYGLPDGRHFDFAPDTLIKNNRITGNSLGVYVADSGTQLIGNDFKTDGGNTWLDVFVGNIWLDAVNQPVRYTFIDKNMWVTNKPLAKMRVATSGSHPFITGSDALIFPKAFKQPL